jgi:hypothetical protein
MRESACEETAFDGEMINSRIMADEPEIAYSKSAVAEPEIEAGESSEEAVKEPDESAAAEGDGVEAGCPVVMGYFAGLRCARKLHVATDGVDEKSVCLMHSKDPGKQSGPLFDAFWLEFERILEDAGEGEAHFESFVFPNLKFIRRRFQAICRFDYATFTEGADFTNAAFTHNAYFRKAIFTQRAFFLYATFAQGADFSGTTFTQNAVFGYATFTQNAVFGWATFTQEAAFGHATFTQEADFGCAIFARTANFDSATFKQTAGFIVTKFHGTAFWHESRFLDRAEFRHTYFMPLVEGKPGAVFALAKFYKPGEIVFDDVDLSRALFLNCDVSQVCLPHLCVGEDGRTIAASRFSMRSIISKDGPSN